MSKHLKYCHVVYKITPMMKSCLEEVPRRGGMYNWMFVFKGSMKPIWMMEKKDFENYDVIQVNMSPVDQILLKEIRDRLPKSTSTLLIANNDFVCETWEDWDQHPLQYLQTQDIADGVFGTEYYQTSMLRDDAFIMPHPHWIHMLKKIGNPDLDLNRFRVGCLYHWWEGSTYIKSLVLEKLRKKFPKLETRLYGYFGKKDKNARWLKTMFDKVMPLMQYPDFQRSLMTNRFVFEGGAYSTYGRTTVDTAALRIPAIGTSRIWSMRHCYPEMCCEPHNANRLVDIMSKVLTDDEWLQKQLDYAYDTCEFFNYDNSRDRYLEMIETVRRRTGK